MRNGMIGYQYQSIYYTEISNVSLQVGWVDKMLGVGDIMISYQIYAAIGDCNGAE